MQHGNWEPLESAFKACYDMQLVTWLDDNNTYNQSSMQNSSTWANTQFVRCVIVSRKSYSS